MSFLSPTDPVPPTVPPPAQSFGVPLGNSSALPRCVCSILAQREGIGEERREKMGHLSIGRTFRYHKPMKYLIVLEKTGTGYSAYSPDLLGCVSTGSTQQETVENMQEAIEFHIEGMKLEGLPVPAPQTQSAYIEVAA
jgi:predicted RNase H-like HicB family nuclease